MALSKQQRCAVDVVLKGHNVFITGKAGLGKSHIIYEVITSYKAKNHSLVVSSTTGISAVVLNGITIHSFAGIGNSAAPDSNLFTRAISDEIAVNWWRSVCTLIIDKVSMLSFRPF